MTHADSGGPPTWRGGPAPQNWTASGSHQAATPHTNATPSPGPTHAPEPPPRPTVPPPDQCIRCQHGGRVFEDGFRRCRKHWSSQDVRVIADLDARGRAIGLPRAGAYLNDDRSWPAGPRTFIAMRRALCDWAEAHDLRYANRAHGCPAWVAQSGRCPGVRRCPGLTGAVLRWLNHCSSFTGPAGLRLVVSQPYHVDPYDDGPELRSLATAAGLHLTILPPGAGFYGNGTRTVLLAGFPSTSTTEAA